MLLVLGSALLSFALASGPGRPDPEPSARRRVCVVRHGESFKNLKHPPPRMSEEELVGLTENGKAQARAAKDRLALGKDARVLASPATRAQATARIIAGARAFETAATLLYLEEGRSAEKALIELKAEIERSLSKKPSPDPLVLVTHSDISALLLGEPRATPIAERARVHVLDTGNFECVTWPKPTPAPSP